MIVPPTKPIRDEIWSKVVREGRLTDAYRDHVQDAINEYRLDLIQFRTSPETKTRIKQALGAISNTESLLTALLADPGYHWAGLATDGPAPNPRALEQASAALAAIRGELESASERLNIRNWQMPKSFLSPERQSTPLTNLITKLLNIQAHCLRQAPPTRPSQSSAEAGVRQFRGYLNACIDFASDGAEQKLDIDRDLLLVTDEFALCATFDDWEERWSTGDPYFMHKSIKSWP